MAEELTMEQILPVRTVTYEEKLSGENRFCSYHPGTHRRLDQMRRGARI